MFLSSVKLGGYTVQMDYVRASVIVSGAYTRKLLKISQQILLQMLSKNPRCAFWRINNSQLKMILKSFGGQSFLLWKQLHI